MNLDNLFKRINDLGLNAKTVSNATGISTGNISDWKSGRSLPTATKLVVLADYLDCSIDYLLGRTDVPEVNKRNEEFTVYKVAARGGEKEIKLNAAQRAELERIINEHKDDDNSDLV